MAVTFDPNDKYPSIYEDMSNDYDMKTVAGVQQLAQQLHSDTTDTNNNEDMYNIIIYATGVLDTLIDRTIIQDRFVNRLDGSGNSVLVTEQIPILDDDVIVSDGSTVYSDDDLIIQREDGLIIKEDTSFDKGYSNWRVVYTAGFSDLEIISDYNNYLDIDETGTEVSISIEEGRYSIQNFINKLQTSLNDSNDLSNEYEVGYSEKTKKFGIYADGTFDLLFGTGSNKNKDLSDILGFDSKDKSDDQAYVSDVMRNVIPKDISYACVLLSHKFWEESKEGIGSFNISQQDFGNNMQIEYKEDELPDTVARIITKYNSETRRRNI